MSDNLPTDASKPAIQLLPASNDSASDPLSRQGILNAKTDRDKVNAAWARVLALGERLESVALAQHELLNAVKEAVEIEKATGENW